jgi:hypothetical protein
MRAVLLAVVLATACTGEVVEPWQLDHDRIVAVRATPPRIPAGATSTIDTLIDRKGQGPLELPPAVAMVVSPESLASALSFQAGQWVVTAPDEAALAKARMQLKLPDGAPVPLLVGVAFPAAVFPSGEVDDREGLAATKTVWLGEPAPGANPVIDQIAIDNVPVAPMQPLVVGAQVDVPLWSPFEETTAVVNWLTSCGTMHDFDLPQAYLRVEPEDPTEGTLAIVVRTKDGGTSWQLWPIRAE